MLNRYINVFFALALEEILFIKNNIFSIMCVIILLGSSTRLAFATSMIPTLSLLDVTIFFILLVC